MGTYPDGGLVADGFDKIAEHGTGLFLGDIFQICHSGADFMHLFGADMLKHLSGALLTQTH